VPALTAGAASARPRSSATRSWSRSDAPASACRASVARRARRSGRADSSS
jgi:hypothetical protein